MEKEGSNQLDVPCSLVDRDNMFVRSNDLWKLDSYDLMSIYLRNVDIYNRSLESVSEYQVYEIRQAYETSVILLEELTIRGIEFDDE